MTITKCRINGSTFVGAFISSTEEYSFISSGINSESIPLIENTLHTKVIALDFYDISLLGILIKANKNGILLSNLFDESDVQKVKSLDLGINVGILKSNLNALGNDILANDKFAIVNPDYNADDIKQIRDVLNVEVISEQIGQFKTVGANNILTNKGILINNNATDMQVDKIHKFVGIAPVRTTANVGSLAIGLSVVANSKGALIGEDTTGFELGRITQALNLE
ncbi:MAG: translation initiation factor IF-6 [Candidatus Micrarchaeia archaeon]